MSNTVENVTIRSSASIEYAFRQLNVNQSGVLFAVNELGRVVGCVTDGDIRRQLLVCNDLSVAIETFMNRNFVWASVAAAREQILKLLDHRVHVVPLLDDDGHLVRLCSRSEFQLQEDVEVFARARAPARITFCGGGTDLTHYFFDQGGVVINATITRYAHATIRRRAGRAVRIYSHDLNHKLEVESVSDLCLDGNLDLIKSVIQLVKPSFGFDLEVSTDFPIGSGLGGSAALLVAIIGCFNEFRLDSWDRRQISEMAFQAERLILNIPGGWQDQYAATFGGFNFMEFSATENVIVPLRLDTRTLRELEESIVLCYTRKNHHSGMIHANQKKHMQGSDLTELTARRLKEIVGDMRRLLLKGEIYAYGRLLDLVWEAKRKFSPLISDAELDSIYDHAMANGALGGKILGAGGGGYFMFFVPPFERFRLCNALKGIGYETERLTFDEFGLQSWRTRVPEHLTPATTGSLHVKWDQTALG